MSYQVISRKWRPQKFEDVIGQTHITITLKNALKANRVAHAYIFTGPRGIGKTSTARILAKALNCSNPKDFNPCNECQHCREITEGNSFDVFEIDGASNRGIDEIRNLRESVKYPPQSAKYKIYIIDEVHMLTKEAFNALLKTLEEPPPQVFFIFATTEPMKVPATIISRCQRFDFRRIPTSQVVEQLKKITETENINISEDALIILAHKGEGSMRDSESLLDQAIAFCGSEIRTEDVMQILGVIDYNLFFKTAEHLQNGNAREIVKILEEIRDKGYDIGEYINGLIDHFRNIMITTITGSTDGLDLPQNVKEDYQSLIGKWSEKDLVQIIQILSDTEIQLRTVSNPLIFTELTLIKLSMLDRAVAIEDILKKIGSSPSVKSEEEPDSFSVHESIDLFKTTKPEEKKKRSADVEEAVLKPVQQPEPEKEKTPIVSGEHLTIGEIRKLWGHFIEAVDKKNMTLGSFFTHAFPQSYAEPVLEIGFDPQREFDLMNVKKRLASLEEIAQEFFGKEMKIKCVRSEEKRNVDIGKEDHKDPITTRIIELFDGEIVKERRET